MHQKLARSAEYYNRPYRIFRQINYTIDKGTLVLFTLQWISIYWVILVDKQGIQQKFTRSEGPLLSRFQHVHIIKMTKCTIEVLIHSGPWKMTTHERHHTPLYPNTISETLLSIMSMLQRIIEKNRHPPKHKSALTVHESYVKKELARHVLVKQNTIIICRNAKYWKFGSFKYSIIKAL